LTMGRYKNTPQRGGVGHDKAEQVNNNAANGRYNSSPRPGCGLVAATWWQYTPIGRPLAQVLPGHLARAMAQALA
jgi:hypothetical protein